MINNSVNTLAAFKFILKILTLVPMYIKTFLYLGQRN